jgi:hypothetical protein
MGRRRITSFCAAALLAILADRGCAEQFRHFGYYLIQSHFKIEGDKQRKILVKPVVFHVSTDGISVKVSMDGEAESTTTFEIYRSDGIGCQRGNRGALEVVPGVQAMHRSHGELRHLRLCKEFMTMTTFPGVSDQTVVIHAIAAEPTSTPP